MDVETAIRTRRTHKAYGAEAVDRATLDELFALATWARGASASSARTRCSG